MPPISSLDEIVVFDLETTGLDSWQDRIIEIGAVLLREGKEVAQFQSLVNPGVRLPREITLLTGITDEALADAPSIEEVLPRFLEFIGDRPLVAHNAEGFDRQFLERALGRRLENSVLDTLPFAFLAVPEAPGHSLASLAKAFCGGGGGRHRAIDDARDLARVLGALLGRLAEMPPALRAEVASLVKGSAWPWKQVVLSGAPSAQRFDWTRRTYAGARRAAVEPREEGPSAIDPDAVGRMFGPGGAVALQKEGFEVRPQQAEMARAVATALDDGCHLAVEAGTGVGKSYAYLIPALLWGAANGRPVVVSTFTKVLQAQLAADVPTLEKVLGRPIRVAIVKGRSNYLCLHKWEEWHDDVRRGQKSLATPAGGLEDEVVAALLYSWEERTSTGDVREELPWWLVQRAPQDLLSRVTIDAEHCPGQRCPLHGSCFVTLARRRALDADLVIVNHRLLLESFLAGRDDLLPPNPVVVIDEAHHLEGVATDVLSKESSQPRIGRYLNEVDDPLGGRGALRRIVRLVRRTQLLDVFQGVEPLAAVAQDLLAPVRTATSEFFADLDRFVQQNAPVQQEEEGDYVYARRLRITQAVRAMEGWDLLRRRSDVVAAALHRLVLALRSFLEAIEPIQPDVPSRMELYRAALASATARLSEAAELHEALFRDGALEGWVVWAESEPGEEGRWTARLKAAAVSVGPALDEGLYAKVRSIVFTSATLTTSSRTDEFRFMKMRTGWDRLPAERLRTLRLDSPFDYERQVLALTLVDLPVYEGARERREAWLSAVAQALPQVLAANHGGTLVLCTSHEQVDRLFPLCRERLEPLGIACLRQRKGQSIRQQVERFREDVDSVLFGTYSLWEGIDVPGEALDGLVILKLPFDPPNDPIVEARREAVEAQGLSGTHYYYFPLAILRLRQGFGRLIRGTGDRGVCVVLDRRLAQAGNRYSVQFRNSLPKGVHFRGVSTEEAVSLIRHFVREEKP